MEIRLTCRYNGFVKRPVVKSAEKDGEMEQFPDEWTQEEYLRAKKRLAAAGVKVLLIDTILSPINDAGCVTYNPPVLAREPEGTVFVFYCDTGKSTKERLGEFRRKFPGHPCVSLRGGRGYWRKYLNAESLDADA